MQTHGTHGTELPRPETRVELSNQIGRGGFGQVYHGCMVSPSGLRQEVAVKILGDDIDPRSQAVQRLRDEGRVLASLQHPCILRAFDLVILQGRVALITEYVPGADLSTAIRWPHHRPKLRAVLELVGHVADALHAASIARLDDGTKLGLVHRDVKPANIRLTPHGTVKLLDFGIAKSRAPGRESRTQTNIMLGSMRYLAPEVITYDVDNGGPEADVYSLGCTLFEALTGENFVGDIPRARQTAIFGHRRRYSALLTERWAALPLETPRAAANLVYTMLARDPAKRPTAASVADRCFEMAEDATGPTLRAWSRSVPWPEDAPGEPGPLSGRSIEVSPTEDRQRPKLRPGPLSSTDDLWEEPVSTLQPMKPAVQANMYRARSPGPTISPHTLSTESTEAMEQAPGGHYEDAETIIEIPRDGTDELSATIWHTQHDGVGDHDEPIEVPPAPLGRAITHALVTHPASAHNPAPPQPSAPVPLPPKVPEEVPAISTGKGASAGSSRHHGPTLVVAPPPPSFGDRSGSVAPNMMAAMMAAPVNRHVPGLEPRPGPAPRQPVAVREAPARRVAPEQVALGGAIFLFLMAAGFFYIVFSG